MVLVTGALCGSDRTEFDNDVDSGCEGVEVRGEQGRPTLGDGEPFLQGDAEGRVEQSPTPALAELESLKLTITGALTRRLRAEAPGEVADKILIDRIYKVPTPENCGRRTEYLVSVIEPCRGGDGWVSHVAVDQENVEIIDEFGSEAFCHATRMRTVQIGGLEALGRFVELWFVTRRGDHFVLLYSSGQDGNVVRAHIVIGARASEMPDLSYLDIDNDGIEEVMVYRTYPLGRSDVILKWSAVTNCFEELK